MKKYTGAAVASLAAWVGASSSVWATELVEVPFIHVTVDGRINELSLTARETDKKGQVILEIPREGKIDLFGADQQLEGTLNFFSSTLNSDPSITYGFKFTDFGSPSSISFLFSTPIVSTGPGTVVSSWIRGTLTDANGDGASVAPTAGSVIQRSTASAPTTSLAVDLGGAFAIPSGPAGASVAYPGGAIGPIAGPTGPFTGLQILVDFQLSGGGDMLELQGYTSIDTFVAVPDNGPGLGGIGALLALAAWSRRAGRV